MNTSLIRPTSDPLDELELMLLLEGLWLRYGYDFRDYARPSMIRRVRAFLHFEGISTLSALQERILRDPDLMARFVAMISVHVSHMFRDPDFFSELRNVALPLLRTYPFVRIWHAGCATGEEVYSLAILLREAGLYERCRIYATDMSQVALDRAQRGMFPLRSMRQSTENYIKSGGQDAFSAYYTADSQSVIFDRKLRENVVFAQHNLVCDGTLNEFHLILCRNVLLYFNRGLRNRVHGLLHASLVPFGLLALGMKESLRYTAFVERYDEVVPGKRLYRRRA